MVTELSCYIASRFQYVVRGFLEDLLCRYGNTVEEHTMRTKKYIIDLKVLPYFGKLKMNEIKAPDIRKWQNELIGQGYAQTYLKTINNQVPALFNYAVKYYDLPNNPCRKAVSMGKSNADDRNFWTQEEFSKFIDALMNKHQSYMAFMILYWTGIRIGELLALTVDDVDFEKCTIRISKSYQRLSVRFRNRRIVRILIWFWPLTGCMVMPKGPGHLYGTASYDPAGDHEPEKDPQADVGSRCIDH